MINQEIYTDDEKKSILLADDDGDDCLLFSNALEEIDVATNFISVQDGELLMKYLENAPILPDIIYLDMNMPRKNGAACLVEIKSNNRLKDIPVVIISTSLEPSLIEYLFVNGAHYFIRKPNSFSKLKSLLYNSIALLSQHQLQPDYKNFILADEKTML